MSTSKKIKKFFVRFALAVTALSIITLVLGLFAITIFTVPDKSRSEIIAKYTDENSIFLPMKNGQIAHIKDEGSKSAQALMMIHGASSSLYTWDYWTEILSKKYRVVRIDLPGHGVTGPAMEGQYSTLAMSLFVDEIIETLKLEKPILIGSSMGGSVALRYALSNQDKLNGLILVGSSGLKRDATDKASFVSHMQSHSLLANLSRYITPYSLVEDTVLAGYGTPVGVTKEIVDRYYDLLLHSGNRQASIDRRRQQAQEEPMDIYLGGITIPTLLIWGEEDTFVPIKYGKRMHAYMPSSKLMTYPGIGHLPMETTPKLSALHVDNFIKQQILP